tara:strand:- start:22 stop:1179 length:1158 start_codon:yes stop_codon:yes gene_type:complete
MPEKFKNRFSLKNQLIKDQIKNFQLKKPSFPKGLTDKSKSILDRTKESVFGDINKKFDNFLEDNRKQLDQIKDDSRKSRALNEYRSRLKDERYGGRNQYGADKNQRDLTVPFVDSSTYDKQQRKDLIKELGKKNVKNYPYLSSYAQGSLDLIDFNRKRPGDPDYNNQQRRNQAAGVDYDSRAVNRYDGTTGQNAGLTPLSDEYYYAPVGDRFATVIGRNPDEVGEFVLNDYDVAPGSMDNYERMAAAAVQASRIAQNSLDQALAAGDFEAAENILSTSQAGIQDLGFYAESNPAKGVKGGPGVSRKGIFYLDSPGEFYGTRVADNLKFRTDRAAEAYKDTLENLERNAYAQKILDNVRSMRERDISADLRRGLDPRFNFDERSGS